MYTGVPSGVTVETYNDVQGPIIRHTIFASLKMERSSKTEISDKLSLVLVTIVQEMEKNVNIYSQNWIYIHKKTARPDYLVGRVLL